MGIRTLHSRLLTLPPLYTRNALPSDLGDTNCRLPLPPLPTFAHKINRSTQTELMMHNYRYTFFTVKIGLFSGTLSPEKLEEALTEHNVHGWRLIRTIHEQKRLWLFFALEDQQSDFQDGRIGS